VDHAVKTKHSNLWPVGAKKADTFRAGQLDGLVDHLKNPFLIQFQPDARHHGIMAIISLDNNFSLHGEQHPGGSWRELVSGPRNGKIAPLDNGQVTGAKNLQPCSCRHEPRDRIMAQNAQHIAARRQRGLCHFAHLNFRQRLRGLDFNHANFARFAALLIGRAHDDDAMTLVRWRLAPSKAEGH